MQRVTSYTIRQESIPMNIDSVWNQGFWKSTIPSPGFPRAFIPNTYFWITTVAVPNKSIPGMQDFLVNSLTILQNKNSVIHFQPFLLLLKGFMAIQIVVASCHDGRLTMINGLYRSIYFCIINCVMTLRFRRVLSGGSACLTQEPLPSHFPFSFY